MGSKQLAAMILAASLAMGGGYWLGRRGATDPSTSGIAATAASKSESATSSPDTGHRVTPPTKVTSATGSPAQPGDRKWTVAEIEQKISALRDTDRRGMKEMPGIFGSLD